MGNLCMRSYIDNYNNISKKKCLKCGDSFKVTFGGFSERMSCRCHDYRNGVCRDCHTIKGKSGYNCYHSAYH